MNADAPLDRLAGRARRRWVWMELAEELALKGPIQRMKAALDSLAVKG